MSVETIQVVYYSKENMASPLTVGVPSANFSTSNHKHSIIPILKKPVVALLRFG